MNEIIYTVEYSNLVESKTITGINDIQSLSTAKIKGWLFNYYSVSRDYQKYDVVNERSLGYLRRIRESTSCEDIEYQNSILVQRRYQEQY